MTALAQIAARIPREAARLASIPAPVLGWNDRDGIADMKAGYALRLDNYIPRSSQCELRSGYLQHATGLGTGSVETMMSFIDGATKKLLAAANGNIYDATSATTATSLASSLSNNQWYYELWQGEMHLANGADTPRKYDGSTISTVTWTGPTATDLIYPFAYKNRLFWAVANDSSFYYGGLNSTSGALTEFALNAVAPGIGNLIAMTSVSVDAGDGPEDMACFIHEDGTVIVYEGTDPSDATKWALVGIYNIGEPVGRRCVLHYGNDAIIITYDGYIPLRSFLRSGRAVTPLALSDLIRNTVNQAVRDYGGQYGWDAVFYPKGQYVLFNVPVTPGTTYIQHVMNSRSGAWCCFKGMNAVSWVVHDKDLYFGGTDGKVYQADSGRADNGSDIQGDILPAYQYVGGPAKKAFDLYRPVFDVDAPLTVSAGLGVDFDENVPVFASSSVTTEGAAWDEEDWDVADWGAVDEISQDWQTGGGEGYAMTIRIRTATQAHKAKFYSYNVSYRRLSGF